MPTHEEMIQELMEMRFRVGKVSRSFSLKDQTKGEMFVLTYLSRNGGSCFSKEIADTMAISSARVAAILNGLETKGMIERGINPENRRQTLVRLLPQGQEVVNRGQQALFRFIGEIMDELGPEDAAEYLRLEKKIADILERKCQQNHTDDRTHSGEARKC